MNRRSRQAVGLKQLKVLGIATSILMVGACSDPTGPIAAVKIVPGAPTVALQSTPQGQVLNTSVTITNTSPYTLYYFSCGVTLEKAGLPALPPGKSDWQTVWSRVCYLLEAGAVFASPLPGSLYEELLKPGASVTIPIFALVGQPAGFTGEAGEYRFHVPLSVRILDTYRSLDEEESVSDPFFLQPAPTG